MSLSIKIIEQEPIGTNCYIISDGKGSIVIDPGSEIDIPAIKDAITGKLHAIILTHLHYDHSAASHLFESPVYIHKNELEDIKLQNILSQRALQRDFIKPKNLQFLKDEMTFGNISFKVIHTPGHTKGGVCLLFEKFIITGDTLFAQTYGRTDIGGNDEDMLQSLLKLAQLHPNLIVYPGHGQATTISAEKQWILNIKRK